MTDPRHVMAGIEGEPAPSHEGLEPGAEIHGRRIGGHADVAQIAGAVPRRNIEAAAEGDRQMREVAADAAPLREGPGRGPGGIRIRVAEGDMPVHEVTDGLHSAPARSRAAE